MNFTQHYSSSAGNLYTLEHDGEKLLIEAGVSISKIREAVGFSLHEYSGCLITHEHNDHSKAAREVALAGVPVYMSQGTMNSLANLPHCEPIEARKVFQIGLFTILPFEVEHDAAEPLGFLIQAGSDKLLFATDTAFVRYCFRGLTHIAIECNWCEELVSRYSDPMHARRLRRSHMSLEQLKGMLRANDLTNVREVHLLHISGTNGDGPRFVKEIERLTGIPTYRFERR